MDLVFLFVFVLPFALGIRCKSLFCEVCAIYAFRMPCVFVVTLSLSICFGVWLCGYLGI